MENNGTHLSEPSYPQQLENQQQSLVSDFKQHKFPMKRIMKSEPNVAMVSAEAPILFSKACEMFLADLTTCSWLHADENKCRTLQKSDILAAVARTRTFDFLVDVLHKDESLADDPNFGAGGDGGNDG